MIPGEFEYHAPKSVQEAIALLTQHEDAKIIAGGHSLLPMMKFRLAEPPHLIDIKNITELKGISRDGNKIIIGSMTNENELIASELLQAHCPLLPFAAKLIADPQIRNKGTIGGDIAHGDPGNDHPALMMALDADFIIEGPEGERVEPANGFYMGTYWTQLEEHDLLKTIHIPIPSSNSYFGYNKLKRKTGDFATAGATVLLDIDGSQITKARIALTNVAPTAIRVESAENLLVGANIDAIPMPQILEAIMAEVDPGEDLRGSAEYKTHMAAEMAKRSINDAIASAKG